MLKSNYEYHISLYSPKDKQGVSDLLESNTIKKGGSLSSDYSPPSIEKMAQIATIVVARYQGEVVGVLITLDKQYGALKPLWVSVLEIWEGSEDALLYGPICISPEHKGKRLISQLWDFLNGHTGGREAILSIKESNESSLRAHRRLGLQEVGRLSDPLNGDRLIFTSRGS